MQMLPRLQRHWIVPSHIQEFYTLHIPDALAAALATSADTFRHLYWKGRAREKPLGARDELRWFRELGAPWNRQSVLQASKQF